MKSAKHSGCDCLKNIAEKDKTEKEQLGIEDGVKLLEKHNKETDCGEKLKIK